jgi:hypothetical protein
VNYIEARDHFQNGDIVFFSYGVKSMVRRAICWFTGGPNYHVGIVFWADISGSPRLMLAESQPGGFRIVNLSFYVDRTMTVFRCPVPWEAIQEVVISSPGGVEYDFVDLALVGLHERFNMPLSPRLGGVGEICSSMVARILNGAGMTLTVLVSPERLLKQFLENKLDPYMVSHD